MSCKYIFWSLSKFWLQWWFWKAESSLCFLQQVLHKLTELQQGTEEDHWAAVGGSKGTSTRRKVKRMVLQLLAARHAVAEGLKTDVEAVLAAVARDGVQITEVGPGSGTGSDAGSGDVSEAAVSTDYSSRKRHKNKRSRKGTKKEKHRSKRKRRRLDHSQSDSSDDASLSLDEPVMSLGGPLAKRKQWHIQLGPYFGDCSQDDCAECLYLLAACNRIETCLLRTS